SEGAESNDSFEGLRRKARVRALTDQEKERIAACERPGDMPYEERKRQLAALDRRVKGDPDSLPPGLLAMYNDAYGSSTKKFELMSWPRKHFMLDPSFQSMTVEAKFIEEHSKGKEGVYEELPLFELEKIYCTEEQAKWLQEKIVNCQEGKEHPQDPANPRARIYKHYKKGVEKTKTLQKIGTEAKSKADIGDGQAGLAARQLLSESLVAAGASFDDSWADSKSAKGKGKGKRKGEGKGPKQVSEEEQTRKELKKDIDAISALLSSCRAASMSLSTLPHNSELLKLLKEGMVKTKGHQEHIETLIFSGKSAQEVGEYITENKGDFEAWSPNRITVD
ncbi:unnamed protein product, partial [Symbiodinium sp. CCMP2456]